ncbi:MAG: hypothetical protein KAF91_24045 [Nostoc sp. TH1S01]|nr:hypothetical protein [Nostoc sp. TH1S01]
MTTQLYFQLIASSLVSGLIAIGSSVPGIWQNLNAQTTLAQITSANEINQAFSTKSLNQISASNVQPVFMLDKGFPERLVIAASR